MVDVGDSTETFCVHVQLFGLMNKTNLNIEYMCLGFYLTTNQHHPVYCTGVVYVYGLASQIFLSTDLIHVLPSMHLQVIT